jgi:hypothetical protein
MYGENKNIRQNTVSNRRLENYLKKRKNKLAVLYFIFL